MTELLKQTLVQYVLSKAPVWLFNEATREFSVQRLYSRYKRDLMSDFKDAMPSTLDYAIRMADAFRDYQCDEIECKKLRFEIDQLKYKIKLTNRYIGSRYSEMVAAHNSLVEKYTKLLQPQMELIKLYKKLKRDRRA